MNCMVFLFKKHKNEADLILREEFAKSNYKLSLEEFCQLANMYKHMFMWYINSFIKIFLFFCISFLFIFYGNYCYLK